MDARLDSIIREVETYSRELPEEARAYWAQHKRRYGYLLRLLNDLYSDERRPAPRRILDVGSSFQTLILARLFPDAHLATLGFEDSRYRPAEDTRHLNYDLNDAFFRDSWPRDEGYDLILMLEVIEHLHTSPWRVLALLRSLSSADGMVVVSTPNAAFLKNRVELLWGRNPFEMLRDSRHRLGLGHYREYTREELEAVGRRAGLKTVRVEIDNVLLASNDRRERIYDRITRLLPPSFRQMITIVFGNDSGEEDAADPDQVMLDPADGWFAPECDPDDPFIRWRWTGKEATISFDNPKRNVMLYLEIAGRGDVSAEAQQVTIVVGGETVDRFLAPQYDAKRKISIGASVLGSTERVELKIRVDRTFVPTATESSDDVRELGVRVLCTAMVIQ